MTTPIHTVLTATRRDGVRSLLMGGQACVVYGASEFSRAIDLAILADEDNLVYPSCLDERGPMTHVMQSTLRGSDRHQSLGRPADEMEIGRVGGGDPRRGDRAGCG